MVTSSFFSANFNATARPANSWSVERLKATSESTLPFPISNLLAAHTGSATSISAPITTQIFLRQCSPDSDNLPIAVILPAHSCYKYHLKSSTCQVKNALKLITPGQID